MEAFGYNQKPWSDEKWLEIGNKMKTSPFVKLKFVDYIAQAEHQSRRFQNLAIATGAVLFVAFLKFPMIRVQPGFRRVGAAGVLSYGFYSYIAGMANEMKVKRIQWAWRRFVVDHQGHNKVTI